MKSSDKKWKASFDKMAHYNMILTEAIFQTLEEKGLLTRQQVKERIERLKAETKLGKIRLQLQERSPSISLPRRIMSRARGDDLTIGLPMVACGLTNKAIASHLRLSEQTIKSHIHRMLRRMGANDRSEAVEIALADSLPTWKRIAPARELTICVPSA